MNRLEDFTSKDYDDYSSGDEVGRKKDNETVRSSLPAHIQACSEQISCQETEKSGKELSTEAQSPKECISITPRTCEKAPSRASPDEELTVKKTLQPPDSPVTGAAEYAVEPNQRYGAVGGKEQSEGEDAEEEDLKAPIELLLKFVGALRDHDFELAHKLCETILIYEPEHPEVSRFLPLIQIKLKGQESDQSDEDDDEEDGDQDDDDKDTESDEKSFLTSSCSSSSSDDDGDDEEDEKQVNRHKLCPPSYISP